MTYFEDRREQRETTYIYWTLKWFDVWTSVQCPARSDPGNKKESNYTFLHYWGRVSLDTAFLANAVKNLWVVLSFNARKAILHYTKTRKSELREQVPVPHDNFLKFI